MGRLVSTHMPLARHDLHEPDLLYVGLRFYSHASCEAWHSDVSYHSPPIIVSTHMPLARHDKITSKNTRMCTVSTHMPLARHDVVAVFYWRFISVSTHMPLARHDSRGSNPPHNRTGFYSHASCEAWRSPSPSWQIQLLFLLTCLLRGMTYSFSSGVPSNMFLLTCLLRGMTFTYDAYWFVKLFLLTCLLRGMTMLPSTISMMILFLLTCLLRGMTMYLNWLKLIRLFLLTCLLRGMTHLVRVCGTASAWFLLTCLLRGMTDKHKNVGRNLGVSTHMPLARHDQTLHSISHLDTVSTHMPLARHD